MTTVPEGTPPLRLEVRGVPLIYAGDELIAAITGWAGASLNEQTEWANRLITAVNEREALLSRVKRLEGAAYHLKLARDAWNFDQTEANFKILGDALDRVVALTE